MRYVRPFVSLAFLMLVAPFTPVLNPATADALHMRATGDLIVRPFGRDRISLDGKWQVIVDPMDAGIGDGKSHGFFENKKPVSSLELAEYAFSQRNVLNVPGDWNSQRKDLFLYQSVVWYRRIFDAPKSAHRQFLYFGAANYRVDVFLNGAYLASHEGGYTPFVIEVTDRLRTSRNLLVVRVDDALSSDTVPASPIDWLNAGGLTRDVDLVSTPKRFIRRYFVRLTDLRNKTIAVDVDVDGGKAGDRIRVEIPSLRCGAAIQLNAAGHGTATFHAPVTLWAPDHPHLYDVRLAGDGDRIDDEIGFRTIARQGHKLLLNGKPLFLKGVSAQDESPLHPGVAYSDADARAILGLVKALGANFVRFAHYGVDEHLLRKADEMGILVWSEIPVWQSVDFASTLVLKNATGQLSDQIVADRNHPSIIIWSVGNETSPSPERDTFLRALVSRVRSLDSTRLVTAALAIEPQPYLKSMLPAMLATILLDRNVPKTVHRRANKLLAKLVGAPVRTAALNALAGSARMPIDDDLVRDFDVVAVNEYFGWYYPALVAPWAGIDEATLRRAENAVMIHLRLDPTVDRPFIVSEFGADAVAGLDGNAQTVYSEAYQTALYRRQFAMLRNSRKLAGMSPWVLMDFPSLMRTRDFINHKGLATETGRKKKTFFVLRDYYAHGLAR